MGKERSGGEELVTMGINKVFEEFAIKTCRKVGDVGSKERFLLMIKIIIHLYVDGSDPLMMMQEGRGRITGAM